MRVLMIHDDCTLLGGSNVYRRQLTRLLCQRGVDVSLFTHEIRPHEEAVPSYCYNYTPGPWPVRHVERYYVNPSLVSALRRWVARMKPDLIHLHHCYRFPTSVLLACRGLAPIVQTVHDFRLVCSVGNSPQSDGRVCPRCLGSVCSDGIRGWTRGSLRHALHEVFPKRFFRGILRKMVDVFIAPSQALENELARLGLRTVFLPHFVDPAPYCSVVDPSDRNTVLFMGYLAPSKGLPILLRAFTKVVAAIPDATLAVVGDGPEAAHLRELSTRLNLNASVKFHGSVPHQDVPAFYQEAAVAVLPSVVMENSPLCIYEAMACGRPVIASHLGGTADLIREGETGFLFRPGDEQALSERLIQLLRDRGRAGAMGEAGRRVVESLYSPARHVEEYLALADRLIGREARGALIHG